ncbi:MAG: zinc/iron-chelating domain-containing protein [Deltaproteobacteria bacterium]|nr:zinc/iron-chelating domain-containing protein [Deltaproteobacteria bacterium]
MPLTCATDAPECLCCGVCCFSREPRYLRVSGDDHLRLGEDAERMTHFIDNRCFMRLEQAHCAALRVEETTARFVCTVYEQRPETCRELTRNSPECGGERHGKAERPAALLTQLRLAR